MLTTRNEWERRLRLRPAETARKSWRAAGRMALVGLLAGTTVGACAGPYYVYRPTEMVNAQTDGYATARYPVPPEAPHGEVYVTSYGVTAMDVAPGAKASMLQVRMVVNNNSDAQPWQIDTRQQLVDLGPQGRSRPAYVNTNVQGSPIIAVAARTQRVIDFYYSLPMDLQGAASVPHFDFLWQVDVPGRPIAERTPFERLQLEGGEGPYYPPGVAVGLGWGPFWWYDPFYPTLTFFHPFILHARYPLIVNRGYLGPHVVGPGFRGYPVGPAGGLRGAPPAHRR